MLDVCVAHPSAPSRVHLAPGAALKYRENAKISAYEPLAKESGCRFVPFAFESFGSLGPAGVAFLRDLGRAFLISTVVWLEVFWQKNADACSGKQIRCSRNTVQICRCVGLAERSCGRGWGNTMRWLKTASAGLILVHQDSAMDPN